MTTFEIILSVAVVIAAGVTIGCMSYIARHAGRDRPYDPERLRRFIANAPYEAPSRSVSKDNPASK